MPGLIGTIHLGEQALQVQRQGIEVSGHNLANVNNPAYSRQRVQIATSPSLPTPIGPLGTGAQVVAIRQLRDHLLDLQLQRETGMSGFL